MKLVTHYIADDGTQWNTAEKALARDVLTRELAKIDALLPPTPNDSRVRVPVDPVTVREVTRQMIRWCRSEWPHESAFQGDDDRIDLWGVGGRIVADSDLPVLKRLWWKLQCIGGGYLYQQAFYAANPHMFGKPGF